MQKKIEEHRKKNYEKKHLKRSANVVSHRFDVKDDLKRSAPAKNTNRNKNEQKT